MSYLNEQVPEKAQIGQLDSFDLAFLILTSRLKYQPKPLILKVLKFSKHTRLFGPESYVLAGVIEKAWEKAGKPWMDHVIEGFDVETLSVNAPHVKAALAKMYGVGHQVWFEIRPQVNQLISQTQDRADVHFAKQLKGLRGKQALTFSQADWDQFVGAALGDHLRAFTEAMPERTIQPEVERLVKIVQASEVHRLIDKAGLTDRLQALANVPQEWLQQTSDVMLGRVWSFIGLQRMQQAGVTEYMVKAQWDKVTCEVCARLDGKTFQVQQAFDNAEGLLNTDVNDLDALASAIPFPRVPEIDNKAPEEVREAGYCPPFHGRCRCDVVMSAAPAQAVTELGEPPSQSPMIERALANDQLRQQYRQYEQEYLAYLKTAEASDIDARYRKDIGPMSLQSLVDWQKDPMKEWGALALKQKALEVEPGLVGDLISTALDPGDEKIIAEKVAMISDEQYLRMRAFNQAYLIFEGVDEQTLYRGTGGRAGAKIADWLFNNPDEVEVTINDPSLAGYTAKQRTARNFGVKEGGVTAQLEIPREQVVLAPRFFSKITEVYEYEQEWIVTGGERSIPVGFVELPEEP